MQLIIVQSILFLALCHFSLPIVAQTWEDYTAAEAAARQLNTCYKPELGLFGCSTGWWNSANSLTALVDLALADGNVHDAVTQQLATTYQKAQQQNPNFNTLAKRLPIEARRAELVRRREYDIQQLGRRASPNGFINGFYDDEGWWALLWIDAYDLTKEITYLQTAINIFLDMTKGWPSGCGNGGIWWDKKHSQNNAIANELFIATGAALALRDANSKDAWTSWSKQGWQWLLDSGLINSQNLINDHLDNDCKNALNETVWSYNQGVILGGLVDLTTATGDQSYLQKAQELASASVPYLTGGDSDHIIGEPGCHDDDCNSTSEQFKGAYIRNLLKLYKAAPSDNLKQVLIASGNGVWDSNGKPVDAQGLSLHTDWAKGRGNVNTATQSSALEALVGMLEAYRS